LKTTFTAQKAAVSHQGLDFEDVRLTKYSDSMSQVQAF
jgi:hypothetical protein